MARYIKLLFIISFVFMSGCAFVPKAQHDSTESVSPNKTSDDIIINAPCQLSLPKWTLDTVDYGGGMGRACNGSGDAALACLAVFGVVIPAGSFLVSGSVVLVGNSLRWMEYQGSCEESYFQQIYSSIWDE